MDWINSVDGCGVHRGRNLRDSSETVHEGELENMAKQPSHKWMILLTLIDTPSEGEEYYNERAIKGIMEILTQGLDIGLSVSKLKIQPLPERLKSPIRGTETVEKRLAHDQNG